MELNLSRMNYTIVGVTSNACMKLLPSVKPKEQQLVAVADNEGVLQIFFIKKEDIQLAFKSLPGPAITSLQLGSDAGVCDKVFVASGNEVRGYSKKGKLFLTFDSNMTEPISSMYILGNDLFLCGKHIYNHYKDCKEIGSYLCGDSIVDIVALYLEKSHRLVTLIACEGRMIRALEHSRVTMSMEVESSPTVLYIFNNRGSVHVLFGTVDGRIGLLDLVNTQSFQRWIISNGQYSSMISSIEGYNISDGECDNLILGRDDGNIEVYSLDLDNATEFPKLIYTYNCNESVTALQGGIFGGANYEEILVSTYTGQIFGLTTQTVDKHVVGDGSTRNYIFSADNSIRIQKLKSEIDELQRRVVREREKYQQSTQSFSEEYSAIPPLQIKHSMFLSKNDCAYILTLEAPTAIDNILLQSDVPVDILDAEKNSAVVSYSDPEPENGNYLLATYRCQINTNRLEMKIRTIEGQYGTLQAYLTPLLQPKCCQLLQFPIRPLSMHCRVHTFDENRPYNTLNFKGSFSLAEMHRWITQCLPEVPERPQPENSIFYFQSTLLGTLLHCNYKKSEAEFKSDNVSTISILREFLSKEATNKKIKIDVSVYINENSISHILNMIDPKLKFQSELSEKIVILDALQELGADDPAVFKSLTPKFKELFQNQEKLRGIYNSRPSYLNRLYGVVTDLYVDYYKFKGLNVKSKTTKLEEILNHYSLEKLQDFFQPVEKSV